jgi:dCMP deaminase
MADREISMEWDKRFLEVAKLVAEWSKDPSTKVGAVLVNDDRRIVGTGYNGFPKGILDTHDRLSNREVKLEMVVHAEINAVLNSVAKTKDTILYCTFFPCPKCASMLIQAGIKRVVTLPSPSDDRYKDQRKISEEMFNEVGIQINNNYRGTI